MRIYIYIHNFRTERGGTALGRSPQTRLVEEYRAEIHNATLNIDNPQIYTNLNTDNL